MKHILSHDHEERYSYVDERSRERIAQFMKEEELLVGFMSNIHVEMEIFAMYGKVRMHIPSTDYLSYISTNRLY